MTPVETYGQLKAKGGYLRDSGGSNKVVLRGMSFYWSSEPDGYRFFNANIVKWMQSDWKVSVLRVPIGVVSPSSNGMDYNTDSAGTMARVLRVVDAAIDQGIYVIIDWHCPIGDPHTSQATSLFKTLATTYKGVPNVMFEVWNEPTSGMDAVVNHANTVISAIRNAGNTNLVIVGSPNWSSQPNASPSVTDAASNVAYSLHFYANAHSPTGDYYSNMTSAIAAGRTVFVTEWGTTNADGNSGYNWSNSSTWLSELEANSVSSCNWDIGTQQANANVSSDTTVQGTAIVLRGSGNGGNWPASVLTQSGAAVRSWLISKNSPLAFTIPVAPDTVVIPASADTLFAATFASKGGIDTASASATGDGGTHGSISAASGASSSYSVYTVSNTATTNYPVIDARVKGTGTIIVTLNGTAIDTLKVSGSSWYTLTDTSYTGYAALTKGVYSLRLDLTGGAKLHWLVFRKTGLGWTPPTSGIVSRASADGQVRVSRQGRDLVLDLPEGNGWTSARLVDVQGRILGVSSFSSQARKITLPASSGLSWVLLDGEQAHDRVTVSPLR